MQPNTLHLHDALGFLKNWTQLRFQSYHTCHHDFNISQFYENLLRICFTANIVFITNTLLLLLLSGLKEHKYMND